MTIYSTYLEKRSKLAAGLERLDVRTASNVLAVDENIGNSALTSHLLQIVLNGTAIRNLIKLNDLCLGIMLLEDDLLGTLAVRAV